MKFKRILSLLLAAMTLVSLLTSCSFLDRFKKGETDTEGSTETETETDPPRTGPYLVINGVDISEFVILKEFEDLNMNYQQIRNAIYTFCRERLNVVEETDNTNLVRIVQDFSLMPNEYCIKVENGELQVCVFSSNFTEAVEGAQKILKDKLVGDEILEWDDGYCEKGSFELSSTPYVAGTTGSLRVYGGTHKNPLSYTEEDEIIFRLSCLSGNQLIGVPWIKYELYNDTTGKSESGYADASTGTATIKVPATGKPGVVYIDAVACDANKQKITSAVTIDDYHFRGSAIVNLKKIKMSVGIPKDFDSFWEEQKTALYNKPLEILEMRELQSGKSGFKLFYVELKCNVYDNEKDGIASGYLTYPTSASANSKLDLWVAFKGYSFSPSDPSYNEGAATFSVCAHSLDCEQAKTDNAYLMQQESKNTIFSDLYNRDKEKCYFRGMILRDLQAARFMVEYFGEKGFGDGKGKGMWNGEKFTASGGSQGAFQAIAVGALDKNITLIKASIPWMCDVKGSNGENGRKKSTFIPNYQTALEYYDTTSFAHLITCEVYVGASLGDGICPASGVVAFYNALKCEKKTLAFDQNASHSAWLQSGDYRIYN